MNHKKATRDVEADENFRAKREREEITICTQVREALKLLKKSRRSKFLLEMVNVDDPAHPIPYQTFDLRYDKFIVRNDDFPSPRLDAYRAYRDDILRGAAGLEVPRTR